jgi:glycosyltransferase involved in cell wall biosynthesis
MLNPRFCIVIPTRNKHTSLKYALLTFLNHKVIDDYGTIVCDNCSSPETRETVECFESEKIKYIQSYRPLAIEPEFGATEWKMTDSFFKMNTSQIAAQVRRRHFIISGCRVCEAASQRKCNYLIKNIKICYYAL